MKLKLFLLLFMMFFLCGLNIANAVVPPDGDEYKYEISERQACNGTMSSGLSCGNGDMCAEMSFCNTEDGLVCSLCSGLDLEGYDYSEKGAYGYRSCFKFCPRTRLYYDNKEAGWLEPDKQNACYGHDCTYENENVYCEDESDECNGYHAEVEGEDKKCVPNMQEWSDETTGESGWEQWTKGTGWVKYTTGCGPNSHLEPTKIDSNNNKEYGFLCNDIVYGKCVSNSEDCSNYFGTTCENNGKNGTVGGTIEWETDIIPEGPGWGDVYELVDGVVDFSNCYCEIEGVVTGAGTATQHCFWGDSGPWGEGVVWSGGCENESFTKCAAGNCDIDNSGICKPAPAGYYGDGTMMACQPCPIGATSPGGSMGENCCYMRVGSSPTRFCDSVGCFDLSGGNIPYDNTTCETVF